MMEPFESLALRHDGRSLWVLDQTQLPDAEVWLDGSDPAAMVALIRRLAVRGAPLIGVAAAASLATFAHRGAGATEYAAACADLRAARPTAVNLMWAIDRMKVATDPVAEARAIFDEDVALCEAIARHGAALIGDGEGLLTHCNTGALATAGIGTALGAIRRAAEQGKQIHVYADETRPLLQGGRLTAWELEKLGIRSTLITDSMAPLLMRDGKVQRVLVGSDRICANGDFANKVGTYGLAVQARFHGLPFHPVAPRTTVDLACPNGAAIPIEERDAAEVRGFGTLRWAPASMPAWNPAFDVTPADLVTSLVLDCGVIAAADLRAGALPRLLG